MDQKDDSPAGALKEYAQTYTELDEARRQIMEGIAEEAAQKGLPEGETDDPCFNGNS